MAYNRFNMRPSMHLNFNETPKSAYIGMYNLPNVYFRRNVGQLLSIVLLLSFVPYLSIQTYRWLDRLPLWERRIRDRREKKMAFDFMLKNLAEKERDLNHLKDYH